MAFKSNTSNIAQLLEVPCKYARSADQLLPIPLAELDRYFEHEFLQIKSNLCRTLANGDFLCDLPAVLYRAQRYVHLNGFAAFSKSERISLLKFCISLVCCPNLDFAVSSRGLKLANFLINRPWTISRRSLVLDWSQFREIFDWLMDSLEANEHLITWSDSDLNELSVLVRRAKRFFPLTCIEEIWLKYRHVLLTKLLKWLDLHSFDRILKYLPLYPKCFPAINRTLLPDVFDLWYLINDFGPRFQEVIRLLSCIARNCPGQICWDPHLERIFSGLLRSVMLPDGPSSLGDRRTKVSVRDFTNYARLLIYAIEPTSNGNASSPVIVYLRNFYQVTAPFYHPSNPSSMTNSVTCFTYHFVRFLYERLCSELLPPIDPALGFSSPEFHLTVTQVDELVQLLLPILLDYMLFCKMNRNINSVIRAIDLLARMRPRFVMPRILACLEDGLSRPEAPLRYRRPLLVSILCVGSFSYMRFPLFLRSGRGRVETSEEDAPNADGMIEDNEDHAESDTVSVQSDSDEVPSDEPSTNGAANLPNVEQPDKIPKPCKAKVPQPLLDKAHIEALIYPEGRALLVRVLDTLLACFDPNFADRFELTIASLCRLFLSTPVRNFNPPASSPCFFGAVDHALDQIEETVTRLYSRLLEHMVFLNDRSCTSHGTGHSSKITSSKGVVIPRPYVYPQGPARPTADISTLCTLTGLAVSIAISTSGNSRFRCQLLRILIDAVFTTHWEVDTARLLAHQLLWMCTNSKESVAPTDAEDTEASSPIHADTAMFALELFWPRFSSLFNEVKSDGSLVYRGRAEPRLLALLYVLPGLFSAVHPDRLVDPKFQHLYLNPLLSMLCQFLHLSTGGMLSPVTSDILPDVPSFDQVTDQTNPCPALAEAASSLLGVLFRRLISHNIDLSRFDLMQTSSSGADGRNLFSSSPYWTPFVSSRDLMHQCTEQYGSNDSIFSGFWIRPSADRVKVAHSLINSFLLPVLRRLDEIGTSLEHVQDVHLFKGFSPTQALLDQRDYFNVLLIWTNNILVGITNDLAPRMPDTTEGRTTYIPPMNVTFFDVQVQNRANVTVGLRDYVFDIGLRLLERIAHLFEAADDTLSEWDETDTTEGDCPTSKVAQYGSPPGVLGALFTYDQLGYLLTITHTMALNNVSSEFHPSLMQTSRGPSSLSSAALGAYSCLGSIPRSDRNALQIVPAISGYSGPPCFDNSAKRSFCDDVPYRGRFVLSWLSIIQARYLQLVYKCLKHPLTCDSITGGTTMDDRIYPTPLIRRLVRVVTVLSTVPRRHDLRTTAASCLLSSILPTIAEISAETVKLLTERLETTASELRRNLSGGTSVNAISHQEFRLLVHRRLAAVQLLASLFRQSKGTLQSDELYRSDTSIVLSATLSVLIQAIERPNVQSLPSSEARYRLSTHEELERQIMELLHILPRLPINFCLSFPEQRDRLPASSWLLNVYSEATDLLCVLNNGQPQPAIKSPDERMLLRVSKRRRIYSKFLEDIYTRCITGGKALLSTNHHQSTSHVFAGHAYVASLFGMIPRPLDAPVSSPWSPDTVLLAPPPPPPPLALVESALNLLTAHHPSVAQAACDYLCDLLFLSLERHRTLPIVEVNPFQIAIERTGITPPQKGPLIPALRPDNAFLLFDENACILNSDESYRQFHHLPACIGTIYHPTCLQLENTEAVLPYPIFDPSTGELDTTKTQWLDSSCSEKNESELLRSCLSLIATRLAGPTSSTAEFWRLFADRLLNLHRKPGSRVFPLSRFIQVVIDSFGPDPLLHHLETFLRTLISVNSDGTLKPFDGVTEIVGYIWLREALSGLSVSAFEWPREWMRYYFARVLPRLLVLAEFNALSVSTTGLNQMGEFIHKDLLSGISWLPFYAGDYGGEGNHVDFSQPVTATNDVSQSSEADVYSSKSSTSQANAGGPLGRLVSLGEFLFHCFNRGGDVDYSLLHPVWEWIRTGLHELHHQSDVSGQPEECIHAFETNISFQPWNSKLNECPSCLLKTCLPLHHRRVFLTRLCFTFIACAAERGIRLYPYFSKCISDTPTDKSSPSTWFQKASDDSVWIRDMAAGVALLRAKSTHTNVFHTRRIPPTLRTASNGSSQPDWSLLDTGEQFVQNFLMQLEDSESFGTQFITDVFLPHLIRDTLTVLRFKGCDLSQGSRELFVSVSQFIPGIHALTPFDLVPVPAMAERIGSVELRPLTNRLRCMYACLPSLLSNALPTAIRPELKRPDCMSSTQVALRLAPLLADVCSCGNTYKRISGALSLGAFGPTGLAELSEKVGDEYMDGLESGIIIMIRRLSLIPLAGQGDPDAAFQVCLDLTGHFLEHTSWKARVVGLLLLRNIIVMNLPAFWQVQWRSGIVEKVEKPISLLQSQVWELLVERLADPWLEVRRLCMCTLAVLVQVGFLKHDATWTDILIHKANTPYPRRTDTESPRTAVYHEAIRNRHAGVLGLAAIIYAHPHTTPEYLPSIIAEVARHAHDPDPIERTVRDTLSAYSRNHQDTWHQQRSMFTEEQLEDYISVVSAATYYV